jgi:hypothetical protein
MKIATIISYPVRRSDNGQDGYYEQDIEMDPIELQLAVSPKIAVLDQIKRYAQHIAESTGLPLHQSHFYCRIEPQVQAKTGLPPRFDI